MLSTTKEMTLILYPRFNELHEDIQSCRELSQMAGEPQCMVLEGLTGAGKSTLVQAYAKAMPRYEVETGSKIPILYVETPSPVTVKGMASRILEELGDPTAYKGVSWAMDSRIIKYIKACEVQLVILDDFHHLIDRETNKILEKVSDWLKVIIKETGIPYLVVGIEGSVEPILRANSQLSRLFAFREVLRPFTWDPSDEETLKTFDHFIRYAEKSIGCVFTDEIDRRELLARLYYVTDGVVGNIMNLMRFAALLARKKEKKILSLEILAIAYKKRLSKHIGKENPFSAPVNTSFIFLASKNSPKNIGSRVQSKKQRKPSAAQVLVAR